MKKLKVSILIDDSIIFEHHGVRRYLFSLSNMLSEYFDFSFYRVDHRSGRTIYYKVIFDSEYFYNNGFFGSKKVPLGSKWEIINFIEDIASYPKKNGYSFIYYGERVHFGDVCIIGAPWILLGRVKPDAGKVFCMGYDAIPIIYSFHSFADEGLKKFGNKHLLGYQDAVLNYDGILAISDVSKRDISSFVGGSKVFVLPPFIPVGFENVHIVDNSRRSNTVILAAPFDLRKGLKKIPDLINDVGIDKLIIYGGVRCSIDDILDFFNDIKVDNVEWWYSVDTAKQIELYSSADLLIFPSYNEGLGLPVLEAMACGVDVFVSDIEPLNNMVSEENIIKQNLAENKDIIRLKLSNNVPLENKKNALDLWGGKKLHNDFMKIIEKD